MSQDTKAVPIPAHIIPLPDPMEAVRAMKRASGITRATCATCVHGQADSDGEHGEIYCGMTCGLLPKAYPTYAEECSIDVDAEKACWVPDFDCAVGPWDRHLDAITGPDDYYDHLGASFQEFKAAVLPHVPDPERMPPDILAPMWMADGWRRWLEENDPNPENKPDYIEPPYEFTRKYARVLRREMNTSRRAARIKGIRRCVVCGCHEADCRRCIERTGRACSWVRGHPNLCTACNQGKPHFGPKGQYPR